MAVGLELEPIAWRGPGRVAVGLGLEPIAWGGPGRVAVGLGLEPIAWGRTWKSGAPSSDDDELGDCEKIILVITQKVMTFKLYHVSN